MVLSFSVVVPTCNRLRELAICLDALARLDYPRERFEVIVVDDAGVVSPQNIIAAYHDRLRVSLFTQSRAGPASARNLGVARATGDYIAFTDDDCVPAPDWLSELAACSVKFPDSMLGGRTLNALTDNLCSTASQLLISYLYEYYNRDPARARFFASNNLAMSRARFVQVGGFDTAYPSAAAEDREFCDRWLFNGNQMIYADRAVVYHAHALALRAFLRQHAYYGRGAVRFRMARARRQQTPVRLEPPGFYVNLVRYPFATLRGARAWAIAGLMILSQTANAWGFFRQTLDDSKTLHRHPRP